MGLALHDIRATLTFGCFSHASHQFLAIYQLGGNGPLLEEAYQRHASYMRASFESPEPITHENYHEHLGDEKYVRRLLVSAQSL